MGKIRVSCVGLCRIKNSKQNYLLGLNKNRQIKGTNILMPLGGSLHIDKPEMLKEWDAIQEGEEQDLRFLVSTTNLVAFEKWFLKRESRELSPFRELQEELVDEYGVLSSLAVSDLKIEFAKSIQLERFTSRMGVTGLLTHYFIELFDVSILNPIILYELEHVVASTKLFWVSEDAIKKHRVKMGDLEYTVDAQIFFD